MALLLQTSGKLEEAEGAYRKAEQLLVKLVSTNAADVSARVVLANCRLNLGGFSLERAATTKPLSVVSPGAGGSGAAWPPCRERLPRPGGIWPK